MDSKNSMKIVWGIIILAAIGAVFAICTNQPKPASVEQKAKPEAKAEEVRNMSFKNFKIFKEFDVLVPDKDKINDLNSWPVVAVDQFTSQPEYWREVRDLVSNKISSYYLVYPEAEFSGAELFKPERVKKINDAMQSYLDKNLFKEYKNSYVYVERELKDWDYRHCRFRAV